MENETKKGKYIQKVKLKNGTVKEYTREYVLKGTKIGRPATNKSKLYKLVKELKSDKALELLTYIENEFGKAPK